MDFTRPDSYASRRDTVAFIVCLLLAVVARATPTTVTDGIASGLRRTVLVPFLALQGQTEVVRRRRAEFDRVVAERDSAVMRASELDMLRVENARLRQAMRLRARMDIQHVAAEVLHQVQPADFETLIVTAGAQDGVREWAPVVDPAGLVGHVRTVDAKTSVVNAWTHPDFRASATTRDGRVTGIVAPRGVGGIAPYLELREVPQMTEVRTGDSIITAGQGGVYPRGIPIGTVVRLIEGEGGFTKTYLVEPAARPAAVSHVLILLANVDDIGHVFAAPRR